MSREVSSKIERRINRKAILDLFRNRPSLTRPQIAKHLSLSLPTVARIVDDLLVEELVKYAGESESTGGRPANLLTFDGSTHYVVGVDLGGTNVYGAVSNLAGQVEKETSIPLTQLRKRNSTDGLCEFIAELLDLPEPVKKRVRGIGVGVPGVTHCREGVVEWAPSLGWRDLPLGAILDDCLHLPAFVENDVALAALGELEYGAGQGVRDLVFISIGTGIGAGIVIDRTLHRGSTDASGEIGFMVPDPSFLGHSYNDFGALETLASGPGMVARGRQMLEQRGLLGLADGLDEEGIFSRAQAGHDWAQQIVSETVDYLALAVANLSAVLNPELVILRGGFARSADMLIQAILARIEGVIPYTPRLVASFLGPRAAAMGAVSLVIDGTSEHLLLKELP
jgi:glucokinase